MFLLIFAIFLFVSREFISAYWSIFMTAVLKSYLIISTFFSVLVSVDCLFSFRLWFSWFLVWWVVFLLNPGYFSYYVRKCWLLLSLNLLFKQAFTQLGFTMWALDSFGGPWFNNYLIFRAFAMLFWSSCFVKRHRGSQWSLLLLSEGVEGVSRGQAAF